MITPWINWLLQNQQQSQLSYTLDSLIGCMFNVIQRQILLLQWVCAQKIQTRHCTEEEKNYRMCRLHVQIKLFCDEYF